MIPTFVVEAEMSPHNHTYAFKTFEDAAHFCNTHLDSYGVMRIFKTNYKELKKYEGNRVQST